jgi:hypothetical protein
MCRSALFLENALFFQLTFTLDTSLFQHLVVTVSC